jgi:hypothetical protein
VPAFVSHFTNSDAPGEINLICSQRQSEAPMKVLGKSYTVRCWIWTDNLTPYPENGPDQSEARGAPGYIRLNGIRLQ